MSGYFKKNIKMIICKILFCSYQIHSGRDICVNVFFWLSKFCWMFYVYCYIFLYFADILYVNNVRTDFDRLIFHSRRSGYE